MSPVETAIPAEASLSDPNTLLRPLGALEEVMWLLDQRSRVNFALVAEIAGHTTIEEWRAALDALQRRHPLLSVCIDSSHGPIPYFRRVEGAPIPLRVVEDVGTQWESEVAAELCKHFDPERAPLMRAVLLYQESKAVFILVAHHSIADGLSSAFAIRDVLCALSGEPLTPLPLMPSREEIFGLPQRTSSAGLPRRQSSAAVPASIVRDRSTSPVPHIQRLRFVPDFTSKLRIRSREERTTVHGALCAALVLAGRKVDRGWHDNPVRIRTSVNIRTLLDLGDDCMLAIGGGETSVGPQASAEFWELARVIKSGLLGVQTREGASLSIRAAHQAVLSGLDVQGAAQLLRGAFGGQTMVTNLGCLPFDTSFGRLKLESLWGPAVLRGIDGEQTLAAVTVNGSLHLLHTSYAPLPALLKNIEEALVKACSHTGTFERKLPLRRVGMETGPESESLSPLPGQRRG